MIYNEFLKMEHSQEYIALTSNYPAFMEFMKRKFKNYELRYESDTFEDLFISVILNNQNELSLAETSYNITKTPLTEDKLGDLSKTTMTTDNSGNNTNSQNYEGYNVEGTFSKNLFEGKSLTNMNTQNQRVNYLNYIAGINSNEFKNTWKRILSEIYSLFIVLGVLYE